jgi:hypothetical protein
VACQCYNITMKGAPSQGNCEKRGEQYQLQPGEPTEEMEEFEVGGKERRVRVGSLLSPEIKESLCSPGAMTICQELILR